MICFRKHIDQAKKFLREEDLLAEVGIGLEVVTVDIQATLSAETTEIVEIHSLLHDLEEAQVEIHLQVEVQDLHLNQALEIMEAVVEIPSPEEEAVVHLIILSVEEEVGVAQALTKEAIALLRSQILFQVTVEVLIKDQAILFLQIEEAHLQAATLSREVTQEAHPPQTLSLQISLTIHSALVEAAAFLSQARQAILLALQALMCLPVDLLILFQARKLRQFIKKVRIFSTNSRTTHFASQCLVCKDLT